MTYACSQKKCQFQPKKMDKKNNQVPTKCSYCDEEMISNNDMTKHYEKSHKIKCKQCEKVFTSEKEQELHWKSNHASLNLIPEPKTPSKTIAWLITFLTK
jgi:uncharacterized C2H2 Zn-finger protein